MKKKQGFTLVELLVVIAIIALLMGILMPALARVRQVAYRMVSGTNQSGIGKAMMIYANDNEGDYPVAGSRNTQPASGNPIAIKDWDAADRELAFEGFSLADMSAQSDITIGSCFYLLVKYADVAPKQFINKSDVGVKEFKLTEYTYDSTVVEDITDAWDFGEEPAIHVSYAYHYPFTDSTNNVFPVTQQSNPSAPVIGDRNPYYDKNATHINDDELDPPEWKSGQFVDVDGRANAACHQLDGQNVLFNDIHVKFEKLSNCGINNDNIYLNWGTNRNVTPEIRELGGATWQPLTSKLSASTVHAYGEEDAFLVSDSSL